MIKKIFYSREEMEKGIIEISRQMSVDNWKPDLIIGITRGGLIPAVYLSQYYDVRMQSVNLSLRDFVCVENYLEIEDIINYKNILIVDDIIDSGETIKVLIDSLEKQHKKQWLSRLENSDHATLYISPIKVATLFYNNTNRCKQKADYFAKEFNKELAKEKYWVTFFYEIWWK